MNCCSCNVLERLYKLESDIRDNKSYADDMELRVSGNESVVNEHRDRLYELEALLEDMANTIKELKERIDSGEGANAHLTLGDKCGKPE